MIILRNFIYIVLICILLYLIFSCIFERESFIVKLVYKSVHQKNVEFEQIETLIDCLNLTLQHPSLIKWDLTGDTELIRSLYFALLNRDIDIIIREVDEIVKNVQ